MAKKKKLKNYKLNIAGYFIGVQSADGGPDLIPSERFRGNICSDAKTDITIKIHSGGLSLPQGSEKVFHAPLVEEINGSMIKKDDNFWSVYRYNADLFLKTIFPYSELRKSATLKFSLTNKEWDLWIEGSGKTTDPLEYPLDSLVLYYLSAIGGDIMIHASGVEKNGKGYIFSGISGKGKTTMAGIWSQAGGRIIHDDRLIIRRLKGRYIMHNTPVYNNDHPSQAEISSLFLLNHGKENSMSAVKGAQAVSLVLANCIQHNWNRDILIRLIDSVSGFCATVPVMQLSFRPDSGIIDFIVHQ